jgi:hypothetical protein
MKNIIRICSVIILVAIIFPQATLAAWWNPITWFNNWTFSKGASDTHTKVLEDRIKELENKLQEVVSTDISTTTSTTTTQKELSPSSKTEENKVIEPIKANIPAVKLTAPVPVQSVQSQPKLETKLPVTFQISNIENFVEKNEAVVTWNTSLPARSRLILKLGADDEKVYESTKDIGVEHQVELSGLSPTTKYEYHITAKTIDKDALEDDVYGSLQTERQFVVSLVSPNGGCHIISVLDTAGYPLVGRAVTVKGTLVTAGITDYKPEVTSKTDSSGSVEYCYASTKFKISTQGMVVELPK